MPKVSNDSVIKTPQRAKPYSTTKSVSVKVSASPSNAPRPRINKIHTCVICKESINEGKKLNLVENLQAVMIHYAGCYYDLHKFKGIIDPGQDNLDEDGNPLEAFGRRFRYKCPYGSCETPAGKRPQRLMGFKEYAIHVAVFHYHLESAMKKAEIEGIEVVLEAVRAKRMKESVELEEVPEVQCEEVHCCFLCKGSSGIDAMNLSFKKEKINSMMYHYAKCYYDTGIYFEMYPPGPENTDEESGQPIDSLGNTFEYSCEVTGCMEKKKMGYRSFCIHTAVVHGGLFEIMEASDDEKINELGGRIQVIKES